jgi:predicted nucleic-acid-binding protein
MYLVDANILLRYLFIDNPEMSQKAKNILQHQEVLILTQVIAETIYVAEGVYNATRQEIVDALLDICAFDNVYLEHDAIVTMALTEYAATKLDFVDALLYAYNQETGLPVETFDGGLRKKLSSNKSIKDD